MRAFRCSRTGMLYPPDYVEEWGKKYGIGLGPVPISEALVNEYSREIVGEGSTAMHPLSTCRAQIDLVEVTEEEYAEKEAILAIDDPKLKRLGDIMRTKQLAKSFALQNKFPIEARDIVAAKELKVKT